MHISGPLPLTLRTVEADWVSLGRGSGGVTRSRLSLGEGQFRLMWQIPWQLWQTISSQLILLFLVNFCGRALNPGAEAFPLRPCPAQWCRLGILGRSPTAFQPRHNPLNAGTLPGHCKGQTAWRSPQRVPSCYRTQLPVSSVGSTSPASTRRQGPMC